MSSGVPLSEKKTPTVWIADNMAYYPFVDIFESSGDHVKKWCSYCKPDAPANFHLYAGMQHAIDNGLRWAGTYIAVLTGKRPVAARQFIVIDQKGTFMIFAPTIPKPEDLERWDPYEIIRRIDA